MLELDPFRAPGEDWCRNQPNVTTLRESLNKPYLLEKLLKERDNPIFGVRKSFAVLRFEELEFGTKERTLEDRS